MTTDRSNPVVRAFAADVAAKLAGLTPQQVRSLDRSGVLRPSGGTKARRLYTFADVRKLREHAKRPPAASAFDLFQRACDLDEDPSRFAEAEALYKQLLGAGSSRWLTAMAHTNLGTLYVRNGRLSEGMGHYWWALHFDPNLAEALYSVGMLLARRGSYGYAEDYLIRAMDLDPTSARCLEEDACRYSKGGLHEEAARLMEIYDRYVEGRCILNR